MTVYEWLALFGVPAVMFAIYELLARLVFRKSNGNIAIKKGIQIILMRDLMQDYRKYMAEGEIDLMDKQIFDKMYKTYHSLGKNGVMDAMYQQVMDLPVK